MPEPTLTLDQERARHAAEMLGTDVSKALANLAASLPGLIVANGLAMTAAYLDEKKEHKMLGDLSDWLLGDRTAHLGLMKKPSLEKPSLEKPSLVESLIHSDSRAVRAATAEALEYLSWYKRLAKARQKDGGK